MGCASTPSAHFDSDWTYGEHVQVHGPDPETYIKLVSSDVEFDIEIVMCFLLYSVKFLPQSHDNLIASCAADCSVRVWDISANSNIYTNKKHLYRAKRLATSEQSPHLFWSAGEDGLVLQHDLREPESESQSLRFLVNLSQGDADTTECKCIDSSPLRPYWLAIGCSDAFVRLFDRRMLSVRTVTPSKTAAAGSGSRRGSRFPDMFVQAFGSYQRIQEFLPCLREETTTKGCVRVLVPGHLSSVEQSSSENRRHRGIAATYVQFSRQSSELLVNLGGEQVYLYDLTEPLGSAHRFFLPDSRNGLCRPPTLSPAAEALKAKANEAFHEREYFDAIRLYGQALNQCPRSSVLWANRAAALMKRRHDGGKAWIIFPQNYSKQIIFSKIVILLQYRCLRGSA